MAGQLYPCVIGGEKIFSTEGRTFKDINPADTGEIVAEFPQLSRDEAARAIDAAKEAQVKWASTPAPERGRILVKAAQILEDEADELARVLTREEGKTLAESRAEVARAVSIFRFYGVMGYRLRGEFTPSAEPNTHLFTLREPLGVVSVITPWNFPIAIPSWKIAPALVSGNAVVFKPASYTPLIGYRIVDALHRAGLPPGVLNLVTGPGSTVGAELINSPKVDAISFTGSLEVGEEIKRAAGGRNIRIQLELGGKNPAVILDDADMGRAVEMVVRGAFGLTGQACTATSRAIVLENVAAEFEKKLVERVKRIKVGNGLVEGVEMGPVVGEKEMNKILDYIRIGVDQGAKLVLGGKRLAGPEYSKGYFLEPTIFTDVAPDMRIGQEEIFGPVLAIMRARNFDEAVELANKIEYGLSASIFTRNLQKAFEFISRVQAGVVKINKPTTGLEPHVPFGGFKKSSFGMIKEQGEAALDFYTKIKTVYLGY
ncbi:Aldehyde dehydrogenase, thermostable [Candidatus Calditenuaceae archaeon HR02]|nr:Aldehyde dehydrogenase, thermostable [Candidatus Calditenuaceae archaeon HR02]